MSYSRCGQPRSDQFTHAFPFQGSGFLTSPTQSLKPAPLNLLPEGVQCFPIAGHSVIIEVPLQYCLEPYRLLRYRLMPITEKLFSDIFDLGPEPFGYGLAVNREDSVSLPGADVRETEEIEWFRFLVPTLLAVFYCKPPELNESGFVFVHLQAELYHSLFQFRLEPFRI